MAKALSSGTDAYFSQVQQRRRVRRRYFFLSGLFLLFYVLIVGGLWIIFRSGVLDVRTITVEGNGVVSQAEILDAVRGGTARSSFVSRLLGMGNMLSWS